MSRFTLIASVFLIAHNAFGQVLLNTGNRSPSLGSTVTGNSVVSNNVVVNGANNAAVNGLASNAVNNVASSVSNSLASNIVTNYGANSFGGNSAAASSIGLSLANNAANNLAVANAGVNNLAVANAGINNLAAGVNYNVGAPSVAVGNLGGIGSNVVANNLGNIGGFLNGLSNVKLGEIEYVKDVAVTGYSGEYPVIGYVTFEGYLPASGTVSVANDGCGCV